MFVLGGHTFCENYKFSENHKDTGTLNFESDKTYPQQMRSGYQSNKP